MEFLNFNQDQALKFISSVLAFLIAIIGHEVMHGLVAKHYGDNTAAEAKRLSINPIRHIHPIGSILVPLTLFIVQAPFLFGWAKPVPINLNSIISKHGYMAAVNVSLAGIAYNLSLAGLCLLLFTFLSIQLDYHIVYFTIQLMLYNLILGIFNLFPIPPLDGSQAVRFFFLNFGIRHVDRFFSKLDRLGIFLILLILATPLSKILMAPIGFLIKFILSA